MVAEAAPIVQKLCNYCNVLRDDREAGPRPFRGMRILCWPDLRRKEAE